MKKGRWRGSQGNGKGRGLRGGGGGGEGWHCPTELHSPLICLKVDAKEKR